MKQIAVLTIVAFIVGCNASDSRLSAEQKIAANFNAEVKVENNTGEDGLPRLKYVVSNSKVLDSIHPNVSSAAIALIAIKGLTKENKTKMKELDVVMFTTDDQVASHSYTIAALQPTVDKMEVFNDLSNDILKGRYEKMESKRHKQIVAGGIADKVEQKMKFLKSKYGKLKGYRLFGIAEEAWEHGTYYQYQGYLDFEKRSVPYLFAFNTEAGKDLWQGFDIKN